MKYPRWFRNLIRRCYLRYRLGNGQLCNTNGTSTLECDYCTSPALIINNGRALCPQHAGYHNASHLYTALRLLDARACRYKPPANL